MNIMKILMIQGIVGNFWSRKNSCYQVRSLRRTDLKGWDRLFMCVHKCANANVNHEVFPMNHSKAGSWNFNRPPLSILIDL